MKRKLFFFDIDGTLTDRNTHRLVPSAVKALQALQEKGHFVALATGRAYYKTVTVMETLQIPNAVCYGGGCLVVDGKVVEMQYLPHTDVCDLLRHAEEDQIGYLLMLNDSDKGYMKDYRFLEQVGRREELTTYIYDPSINYQDHDILKVYLAMLEEQEKSHPWIQAMPRLRFSKNYLIFQYDAKKTGILKMLEHIHGNPEDVVVFGDDVNDLDMFDERWFCVAMGNGHEKLKEKADYVAAKNTEDGIYKTCKEFGWI